MAVQYAPLFALETQFQAKNGRNLTGGFLRVFYAATDDPADTYSDYNLTRNPDRIVLDDNGRALVICDKSKAYRLEVYDAEGMLLWTEEPVYCSGTGGGGVSITKVISTDGSISIDESVAGSTTTYDIGLAPRDSDEFLEWIKCSEEDCGSTWYPVYQSGTMETEAGQGIKVHKGQLYHFTSTFYVDPDGTGISYDTFKVLMYCNDEIVDSRNFDIDTSVNDAVQCEFSTDVIPEEDGHVYFKLTIPSTCEVTGEVQAHRIYSGINAVPDTCATKQWVQETFDMNLSSKVDYSAIEYNQYNEITGISGSAIAGGINSAVVSSIASAYAESAASSKQDISGMSAWIPWSSSGVFQPSGSYQTAGDYAYNSSLSSKVDQSAFDDCCSAVHSALDDKFDKSASGMLQPSGDYAYNSSLSAYYPASASGAFQPSGNYQTAGDYAFNSSVSSKLDASASSNFVVNSAMSSWIPYSALDYSGTAISGIGGSSLAGMGGGDYTGIYPVNVDNTAREISVDSLPLVTDSSMTAYGSAGSSVIGVNMDILSSKLDASASSQFQPSGDYQMAGDYAYNSAVSGKLDSSAFTSYSSTVNNNITSIENNISSISSIVSGKADASAVHTYTGIDPIVVDNENDQISLSATAVHLDSSMTAYTSGGSGFIGVNGSITSQMTAFVTTADMSGYIPTSESSKYYSTSNPSSFATTTQVAEKLDASASSGFYSTSNPSGFLTSSYTPAFGYKDGKISSIDGSAVVGGFAYTSPSATIDIDNVNGTLEATRYAIRKMPAVNWTSTLAPNSTTAYIDYGTSTLAARSATLTFTDISGATQLKVSALSSLDSAAYHYIGDAPTLTIPSAARDLLFVSGNMFGWSAKVTISAPAEPDRVDPLLYSSDRAIESIGMAKGGAPYITSLNQWKISASVAGAVYHADEADYATNANSSTSAMSAHKAVSAQAALKYFTGASSSDTAFISALKDTYGYADSKITAINGSALAANMYTSPSGTLAIDNDNGTIDVWNSSMRVDEHVTAASSFPGTVQQVYSSTYSAIWTGNALPGDVAVISSFYQSNNYQLPDFWASAFGKKVGGGTAKLAELYCTNTGSNPYRASGTTSVTLDAEYSGIYMLVSSQYYLPQTGQYMESVSGLANVERPGQTASSTSVYENVLKDSMWQSLTAWAASQGWTP